MAGNLTDGELVNWLRTIDQMVGGTELAPLTFTDRELATVLAALRYWQRDLAANEEGPVSEHAPLTVDEIDELCERINWCPSAA